jgi:hypothetical protein
VQHGTDQIGDGELPAAEQHGVVVDAAFRVGLERRRVTRRRMDGVAADDEAPAGVDTDRRRQQR